MKVFHNNQLFANLGDVLTLEQVSQYLDNLNIEIPIGEIQLEYTEDEASIARKSAYQLESDPLYMEWQFDQTDEAKQRWLAKVAEIKTRYPFPIL
ncbi:hypothetical protein [Pseudoalteromonas xiamenensis]